MTNYDVVKKLVGEIKPIGETYADLQRFENLEKMTVLVNLLVQDIDQVVYENKNRIEYSIKRSVDFASKFLKDDLGIKD